MKLAALAAVLAVVSVGSAGARGTACRQTDVVFYTTDSVRLATELSKNSSACADYFLSVTPTATGAPRSGPPATIHALGPHFHVLAEIRLNLWSAYAATHGWNAAGIEVRREMQAAGYDVASGDSWAINEVGEPTGTQMGIDVLKNTGTARQDLRDFVRGLAAGDTGVTAKGLVFAADPLQVTGDVSPYKQELAAWYSDAAFWQDMGTGVRWWAQEAYADARSWGVDGATLAQRAAYLNDYFLHGARLAMLTAPARAFFAAAYTPLGNASYRWGAPDTTTGIGFGYTDVGVPGMQAFVSSQVYALRTSSPTRFGFAFVPQGAVAADTLAVADRLAAAIHDSEEAATGACGADGSACAGTVAGAAFNDAWKEFANTLEGANVLVRSGKVSVRFAAVTGRGVTYATAGTPAPAPRRWVRRPGALAYTLTSTAVFSGRAKICVPYSAASYRRYKVRLFRNAGGTWTNITTNVGPSSVCGRAGALGTFAVFAQRRR